MRKEKLHHNSLWCRRFTMQRVLKWTIASPKRLSFWGGGGLWFAIAELEFRKKEEEVKKKKKGDKKKKTSKKWSEYGWRKKKHDVISGEAKKEEKNKRCISAYCSSCDAGQCSSTEPVMSLMQHAIKVILHKPPFSTLHSHTQCRGNVTHPPHPSPTPTQPPTPILSSCPSPSSLLSTTFPRCTGAVRARH